jgi:hypothetical protein
MNACTDLATVPQIMSHASPFAQVPEEFREKVCSSGIGMLVLWAPQDTILEHPVCTISY